MRTPGAPGQAAFLLELASCRSGLRRLANAARGLPEGDDYHDARDMIGVILNRIAILEERALRWSTESVFPGR